MKKETIDRQVDIMYILYVVLFVHIYYVMIDSSIITD